MTFFIRTHKRSLSFPIQLPSTLHTCRRRRITIPTLVANLIWMQLFCAGLYFPPSSNCILCADLVCAFCKLCACCAIGRVAFCPAHCAIVFLCVLRTWTYVWSSAYVNLIISDIVFVWCVNKLNTHTCNMHTNMHTYSRKTKARVIFLYVYIII